MGILGSGSIHMQSRFPRRAARGRDGNGQQRCQRCLQIGHWTYECKNPPAFLKRPSRSQQLKDPKCRQRLMDPDELPDECKPPSKKQKTAPSTSSSSTSSSNSSSSSESSSSSSSATSSSSSSSSDGSSSTSGRSTGSSSSSSSGSDSGSDSDISSGGRKPTGKHRKHHSSKKPARHSEKSNSAPGKKYSERDIAEWKKKVESMANRQRMPMSTSGSSSTSDSSADTSSPSGSKSSGSKASEKSAGRWQLSRVDSLEVSQQHARRERTRERVNPGKNPRDSQGLARTDTMEKDKYSHHRHGIDSERSEHSSRHTFLGRDGGRAKPKPRLKSVVQLREKSPLQSDDSGGRWGMA